MSEQVKRGLSYFSGSRNYPLCNNAVMVRVLFLTPPLFPGTSHQSSQDRASRFRARFEALSDARCYLN